MNQRNQEILKKIGIGIIICIVSVLTFKFIMWNKWKVERSTALAKKILRAPAAVNLTISNREGVLFQKSFANNPNGNYYIINHFDITPHVDRANRLTLTVMVNGQKAVPIDLHRFKTVNILHCTGFDPDIYFAFTTRDCEMEEFVRLIQSLPSIINSLKTQK
ncbi:MAG: hypothetical protein GTN53_09750 [Candidatus Aminicenantes bacterium]|nr:hypothetical protein [Candidatus Aminicenantes bacterium]NIQ67093.1 hypothetical protein [Candidatus Aminicenantes bacterium]NIT22775.1 hypothetical protein [Candidatus Aminicenantes bacterium]